jgi:hypothetical protein
MAALWPDITDDDGTGQTGTILNKAVLETAMEAALDDQLHSTTNPTIQPKDITDEVVTARGNKTSLTARLDGVIDNDGALIPSAGLATTSHLATTLGAVNLIPNDTFLIWPGTSSLAPAYWTLAGSTIARTGIGLADTKQKVGSYALSLTGTGTLTRTMLDAGVWATVDILEGSKLGFGCWVWTTIASHARIQVTDGTDTTSSSWHTGGSGAGGWEWLSGVHTVSAAATKLEVVLDVSAAGTAYFDGVTAILSDEAPPRWIPSPKIRGALFIPASGVPVVADGVFHYVFQRPAIITDVQAYAGTAPGGAFDFDIDIEKYETTGPGWQSIFTGAQTILTAGAVAGSVQPDGDYHDRCFTGASGATVLDALLRLNYDTIGGATADTRIMIRCLQYTNPLEDFLAYNDL